MGRYAARMRALLTMLLLGAACRTPKQDTPAPQTRAVEAADSLEAALDRIDASRLRTDVSYLASDDLEGRLTPSVGLDQAATYLDERFASSGLQPGPGGRRMTVACGATGQPADNVLAMLPGTGSRAVLVTAHYDHVGRTEQGDDTIFNGANDNASGVAAMLAIADALAHAPTPRRRSIVFVAFCGEEQGLRGSHGFVQNPPLDLASIDAVLNLEMLGHADDEDPRRAWVTGHGYSNLSQWLDRNGALERVSFVPGSEIGAVEGNAFHRSDNYPFARSEAAIVAHTIAAGPLDEHYHAVTDETDQIDFDAMVPIVRALARTVDDLARGDTVPAWTPEAPL